MVWTQGPWTQPYQGGAGGSGQSFYRAVQTCHDFRVFRQMFCPSPKVKPVKLALIVILFPRGNNIPLMSHVRQHMRVEGQCLGVLILEDGQAPSKLQLTRSGITETSPWIHWPPLRRWSRGHTLETAIHRYLDPWAGYFW